VRGFGAGLSVDIVRSSLERPIGILVLGLTDARRIAGEDRAGISSTVRDDKE
jgi:hypothetical protein